MGPIFLKIKNKALHRNQYFIAYFTTSGAF